MNIEIEKIPSCRIAYMRRIGPYGTANSQLMEKFKGWVKSNISLDDKSIILGIAQDNPAVVKPEDCRYDVCLVIPDDYCVNSDRVSLGRINGGRYAVFKINHNAEAIQKAWVDMFAELDKQGFRMDEARPILERYIGELVSNHYCEICVPVQ
jgi:DNA gyrase inhibitor GyrI